ncbi:hypothetical protein [Streptomyces sp. NRRL F-5630]|uniref:hypothetical protein n=1 Tax=Streptomyces sp. NRRL F-5630 TaxID=1463864 RepID=UPI003D72D400
MAYEPHIFELPGDVPSPDAIADLSGADLRTAVDEEVERVAALVGAEADKVRAKLHKSLGLPATADCEDDEDARLALRVLRHWRASPKSFRAAVPRPRLERPEGVGCLPRPRSRAKVAVPVRCGLCGDEVPAGALIGRAKAPRPGYRAIGWLCGHCLLTRRARPRRRDVLLRVYHTLFAGDPLELNGPECAVVLAWLDEHPGLDETSAAWSADPLTATLTRLRAGVQDSTPQMFLAATTVRTLLALFAESPAQTTDAQLLAAVIRHVQEWDTNARGISHSRFGRGAAYRAATLAAADESVHVLLSHGPFDLAVEGSVKDEEQEELGHGDAESIPADHDDYDEALDGFLELPARMRRWEVFAPVFATALQARLSVVLDAFDIPWIYTAPDAGAAWTPEFHLPQAGVWLATACSDVPEDFAAFAAHLQPSATSPAPLALLLLGRLRGPDGSAAPRPRLVDSTGTVFDWVRCGCGHVQPAPADARTVLSCGCVTTAEKDSSLADAAYSEAATERLLAAAAGLPEGLQLDDAQGPAMRSTLTDRSGSTVAERTCAPISACLPGSPGTGRCAACPGYLCHACEAAPAPAPGGACRACDPPRLLTPARARAHLNDLIAQLGQRMRLPVRLLHSHFNHLMNLESRSRATPGHLAIGLDYVEQALADPHCLPFTREALDDASIDALDAGALRREISRRTRPLWHLLGRPYSRIDVEVAVNRACGVRLRADATADQLREGLRTLQTWVKEPKRFMDEAVIG